MSAAEHVAATYTDSDRLRELAAIRSIWVDTYVERRLNHREGDATVEQIVEWEAEGYRRWRGYYPALNSLFPSHLPAENGTAS